MGMPKTAEDCPLANWRSCSVVVELETLGALVLQCLPVVWLVLQYNVDLGARRDGNYNAFCNHKPPPPDLTPVRCC